MSGKLGELFNDDVLREKIRTKLPYLFQVAELESSRAGKVGMEVGSAREKVVIALLIYKFGEQNITTEIPITEPEIDVRISGQPVSIKTITDTGGVKAVWTVDAESAKNFAEDYLPKAEILLVQIKWEPRSVREPHPGGLYWIPLQAQHYVLEKLGNDRYLKQPKPGTNPRGVEFSKEAMRMLLEHKDTKCIEINWRRSQIDFNPYKKWVDYWRE